jgi:hypothetical protein
MYPLYLHIHVSLFLAKGGNLGSWVGSYRVEPQVYGYIGQPEVNTFNKTTNPSTLTQPI